MADPVPAPTVDLDAIRARAEAATRGPWFLDVLGGGEGRAYVGNRAADWGAASGLWSIVHSSGDALGDLKPQAAVTVLADAEFIAHARADIPALIAEVRVLRAREAQVRELHRRLPDPWNGHLGPHEFVCDHDGRPWPCPTAAVLDGTTGSGKTG